MLNATDGVGDFGEIDPSGTENYIIDTDIALDSLCLSYAFDVKIRVFFVREHGGPNALFHPGTFPGLAPFARYGKEPDEDRDGTILLGTRLMKSEIREGRRYAILAILGHESAHAMQKKNQCALPGKWRELHADYMGGYWMARRKPHVPNQDPRQAYRSLCLMGDYHFNQPGHHGTPDERGNAFEAGYRYGLSVVKTDPEGSIKQAEAAKAYHQRLILMESLESREDAVRDRRD